MIDVDLHGVFCSAKHALKVMVAYDDPGFVEAMTAFTPMGRVPEAAEIGPALFLASAASDYMTGQLLIVDGGCMAK